MKHKTKTLIISLILILSGISFILLEHYSEYLFQNSEFHLIDEHIEITPSVFGLIMILIGIIVLFKKILYKAFALSFIFILGGAFLIFLGIINDDIEKAFEVINFTIWEDAIEISSQTFGFGLILLGIILMYEKIIKLFDFQSYNHSIPSPKAFKIVVQDEKGSPVNSVKVIVNLKPKTQSKITNIDGTVSFEFDRKNENKEIRINISKKNYPTVNKKVVIKNNTKTVFMLKRKVKDR